MEVEFLHSTSSVGLWGVGGLCVAAQLTLQLLFPPHPIGRIMLELTVLLLY